MRPIWTGSVGFGLVNIPVAILSGLRSPEEELHERHARDGSRIERKLFCSREEVEIQREDVERAFDLEGTMVPITDEEVESVAPYPSRTIDIECFISVDDLVPTLRERPYFLDPGDQGEGSLRAYHLLASALEAEKQAAMARFVMRSSERLAAITSTGRRLCLETLHYPNELRSHDGLDLGISEVDDAEVSDAIRLIEGMSSEWHPEALDDERAQRLRRLASEKQARGELVRPESGAEPEPPEDLMAALKKSLDDVYSGPGDRRGRKRSRRPRARRRAARPTGAKSGGLTRDELYERARKMDIPGRSRMSKKELEKAVLR